MSELTRKKDELSSAIEKYNEALRTYKELLELLTGKMYCVLFVC